PISAILFGGRRATNVPLITEANDWNHGVFLGSIMSSEKTAAAAGTVGQVRFDPFAMLPFCGYNMADYFAHWLEIGSAANADNLPKLFWVNWFRRDDDGNFLWPGFGENSRILKFVVERVAGEGEMVETAIGNVPAVGAIDIDGLDLDESTMAKLLTVDNDSWMAEIALIRKHFARFGDKLPAELAAQLDSLEKRLVA
ncbi:MAG: phosphoenolpyruvate carboxykinase (GTP), partial [Acidimicrobiia bacterium]|nr:phosphoenolpyruvate carboxykinase (GTP) [Acidimicrobiia bacterium]